MIYLDPPENFIPKLEIISCFVESDGEVLLLHRQDYKPQGDTWGVPAGKIDQGESEVQAMARELHEETGIELIQDQLEYFKKVYVRYPDYDFTYTIFHTKLDTRPEVVIAPKEHKEFKWINPKAALGMPLIQDLDACLNLYFDIS